MQIEINHKPLELVKGDITEQESDAIVNAANSSLILGAGVAGAIRSKGGPAIQQECDQIGGCPVGGAAITTGGNLKAKHVIHAVGPRIGEGNEDEKLKNATLRSLKVANDNGLKSISFPAISTGIFGFPIKRCAEIMLSNTIAYLKGDTGVEKVIFCLYGQEAFDVFKETLEKLQK
jgi:O-acetyl-ADP-ribose deacetylase (regulator of RNase III)